MILNVEKRFLIISLIQNLIYIFIYRPRRIISLKKLLVELEIDEEYFEYSREFVNVIISDKKRYNDNIGLEKESFYIKRIIADYLLVRDFKNAEYYASILSSKGFDKGNEINVLICDIKSCLLNLKQRAEKKNFDHIVMNWVDNVSYNQLLEMPFLKNKIKKGINFTNMYCLVPYTTPAVLTLFTGNTFIDDRLFCWSAEKEINGKLISFIQDNGYELFYLGNRLAYCFPGKVLRMEEKNIYYGTDCLSTVFQYELLCKIAEADSPTIFIVHNFVETHWQHINPENMPVGIMSTARIRKMICKQGHLSQEMLRQMKISSKYLDSQLEYYNHYYADNIKYEIFFSDHGFPRYRDKLVSDDIFHIFMGICGNGVTPREINSIQSFKAIADIIMDLITDDIKCIGAEYKEEYVPIQYDDMYNPFHIKEFGADLIKQYGKVWFNMINTFQYRGVVTKEDCYIRWASGVEYYERNGDSENLINESQWQDRIAYLKKLTGKKYINTFSEKKYRSSKRLYKLIGMSHASDNEYV